MEGTAGGLTVLFKHMFLVGFEQNCFPGGVLNGFGVRAILLQSYPLCSPVGERGARRFGSEAGRPASPVWSRNPEHFSSPVPRCPLNMMI